MVRDRQFKRRRCGQVSCGRGRVGANVGRLGRRLRLANRVEAHPRRRRSVVLYAARREPSHPRRGGDSFAKRPRGGYQAALSRGLWSNLKWTYGGRSLCTTSTEISKLLWIPQRLSEICVWSLWESHGRSSGVHMSLASALSHGAGEVAAAAPNRLIRVRLDDAVQVSAPLLDPAVVVLDLLRQGLS